MGDTLLQKSYTTETIPFRKIMNHGEKTQYYVENANPAIVSRETYNAAQALQKTRLPQNKRNYGGYCLSNMLYIVPIAEEPIADRRSEGNHIGYVPESPPVLRIAKTDGYGKKRYTKHSLS